MSPMPMRDHEARTSEIGDVDPLDESTLHRARLTVAAASTSTEEAITFMKMLGIHPDQHADPAYSSKTMAAFGGGHQISSNPRPAPTLPITLQSLADGSFDQPIPPSKLPRSGA